MAISNIVVGTCACCGKRFKFRDLGLLSVDESSISASGHTERLKSLRAQVHV